MPKLARTIHFDESDQQIFARFAATGEWAISGGFEFSNWTEDDIQGKARQAFANGWLGVGTFGRATFVAVAQITDAELEQVTRDLADHLMSEYNAPSMDAALHAAVDEIVFMQELCQEQEPNTLITISRELTDTGVHEQFRSIKPKETDITQLAVHGSLDP